MEELKGSFMKTRITQITTSALMLTLILTGVAAAELKLPAIISDHMVLQQDKKLPIWGWAEMGKVVTVRIDGHAVNGKAGSDGKWSVKLPRLDEGGPYEMKVSTESESITVKDILVGETWVCSGQSNMGWQLRQNTNAEEHIARASYPGIRLFTVILDTAEVPKDDCRGQWVLCTPESAAGFSAVGYFFGIELHRELDVPVGLINTSWGGSPSQAWTSYDKLSQFPDAVTDNYWDTREGLTLDRPALEDRVKEVLKSKSTASMDSLVGVWDYVTGNNVWEEYQARLTISMDEGKLDLAMPGAKVNSTDIRFKDGVLEWTFTSGNRPAPINCKMTFRGDTFSGSIMKNDSSPSPTKGIKRKYEQDKEPGLLSPCPQFCSSRLYNAMVMPLIPYTVRGAIWYQGEANADQAYNYRSIFPAMIDDWRQQWDQGDFPFYFVQIAPYNYGQRPIAAELREAQRLSLKTKNTGMVVTTDIATVNDIHPPDKQEVGRRLALCALAKDYGKKNLVHSGPLYRSMKTKDKYIQLRFDHIGGGLVARNGELTDFTIAGSDQQFLPANAKIQGKKIIVWSDEVIDPVAVRFGWTNTAEPNLFTKEGLPASTFRTDDWPCLTHPSKKGNPLFPGGTNQTGRRSIYSAVAFVAIPRQR
jgi:sialate O-acetylesterase